MAESLRDRAFRLHAEMYSADDAFQAALVSRYGKDAGDMRYSYYLPDDLRALGDAYVAAADAWRAAYDALTRADAISAPRRWTPETARRRVGGTIGT